jgi:hypothetical protein
MIGPAGYRSCLAQVQVRRTPSDEDLFAMRRAAWRQQGVIMLRPEEVRDDLDAPGADQRGRSALRPPVRGGAMSTRIQPHDARRRELEEVREVNPDGRIVVHHLLVDTLGRMLRSGTNHG